MRWGWDHCALLLLAAWAWVDVGSGDDWKCGNGMVLVCHIQEKSVTDPVLYRFTIPCGASFVSVVASRRVCATRG